MNELILVVDDEPKIVRLARDYLERSNFRVLPIHDGVNALIAARQEKPDLIVLDLNLPGMDGIDLCRVLRRESSVPIIMLTARVEETDRLIGLEVGADDYIIKPFSPRELVARVRAVLRRTQGEVQSTGIIRVGALEIDLNGHHVSRENETIKLTRIEFALLATLAQHPGQTFSRSQLIQRLHGSDDSGFDRSIDAHIKNLRRKLEDDPAEPRYIQTVYGIGYKFAENGHAAEQKSG
jgi:DNA-binding response OmpR family regulator